MLARLFASALALLVSLALGIAPATADQSSLWSPTTGTVSGLNLTNNFNAALNALATCNSGAGAPNNPISGAPVAGQCWLNTSTGALQTYDGANWLTLGYIDSTGHLWRPVTGGGVDNVASAGTTNLCSASATATVLNITGTATITSFGSGCQIGQVKVLAFQGASSLTNSGSLVLTGGANITAVAGDMAIATYFGSSTWVVTYFRASGVPVIHGLVGVQVFTTSSSTYTPSNGAKWCEVEVQAASGSSGGVAATSSSQNAIAGGSSAGSYVKALYACATISGDTVAVGAAGTASIAGNTAGTTATATTVGAHVNCAGGIGGGGGAAFNTSSALISGGGANSPSACTVSGAVATEVSVQGQQGGWGISIGTSQLLSGAGADAPLGAGGPPATGVSGHGNNGTGYGSGASGAFSSNGAGAQSSTAGSPGEVIVREFN